MGVHSIADVAAHLTRASGEYFTPSRVAAAIQRLVERGELAERRAGRQRVMFDADLRIIEGEFGINGRAAASGGETRANA